MANLLVGGTSGTIAASICYPLDTIRRRMQMKGQAYKNQVGQRAAMWGSCGMGATRQVTDKLRVGSGGLMPPLPPRQRDSPAASIIRKNYHVSHHATHRLTIHTLLTPPTDGRVPHHHGEGGHARLLPRLGSQHR